MKLKYQSAGISVRHTIITSTYFADSGTVTGQDSNTRRFHHENCKLNLKMALKVIPVFL
jgi:hypothetical protein